MARKFIDNTGLIHVFSLIKTLVSTKAEKSLSNVSNADFKAKSDASDIVTTTGTGTAYVAAVPGITALTAGVSFVMIPHTANTAVVCTLNVNSLGAKNIRRRISNSSTTTTTCAIGHLAANKPIRVIYDGNYWIPEIVVPNATELYGTLALAKGGTGAATAEGALANLGGAPLDTGVAVYTHAKSGTVHSFTGTGSNGKAKITADFASGDTFKVNGTTVSAFCGADAVDGDTIVNGRWVYFAFDGSQLNFKGGGGLGSTKLSATTAGTGDVLSGKTFYSGNKTLKTGTIASKAAATYSPKTTAQTISAGQYLSGAQTIAATTGTANTGHVLKGYTFNSGKGIGLTGTIASKAAATYGAKTSAQTIAAGQYLSGAQTIAAVTQTNLSAANIIKGKTVTISSNGSNLWSVTGTGEPAGKLVAAGMAASGGNGESAAKWSCCRPGFADETYFTKSVNSTTITHPDGDSQKPNRHEVVFTCNQTGTYRFRGHAYAYKTADSLVGYCRARVVKSGTEKLSVVATTAEVIDTFDFTESITSGYSFRIQVDSLGSSVEDDGWLAAVYATIETA